MRRVLIALSIVLVVAACDAVDFFLPLTPPQLCLKRDSLWSQMKDSTIDDQFELLAQLLPGGFGGLTSSFLYLKHPEQADPMRRTAKDLLTCPGKPLDYLVNVQQASVRAGDYDWIELRGWYRLIRASIPATWNSADMDEGINRLRFTFPSDSALAIFRTRVNAAGVPDRAVVLTTAGPFINFDSAP